LSNNIIQPDVGWQRRHAPLLSSPTLTPRRLSTTGGALTASDLRDAAHNGSRGTLERCLEQGVDINAMGATAWTALHYVRRFLTACSGATQPTAAREQER